MTGLSRAARSTLKDYGLLLPGGSFHSKISPAHQRGLLEGKPLVLTSGSHRLYLQLSPITGKLQVQQAQLSHKTQSLLEGLSTRPIVFGKEKREVATGVSTSRKAYLKDPGSGALLELPLLSSAVKLRRLLAQSSEGLSLYQKELERSYRALKAELKSAPENKVLLSSALNKNRRELLELQKQAPALEHQPLDPTKGALKERASIKQPWALDETESRDQSLEPTTRRKR